MSTTEKRMVTLKESDALRASTLEITTEQMELIKRTVAADARPEELELFLFDCKRQGVHPLDKLLHFSVRTNRRTGKRTYTPITAVDFMRIRAAETGEYAGSDDVVHGVEDGDKFARKTVYRFVQGVRCPFTATAWWSEYDPGEGPDGFMYRKMPKGMLGKCAEALALRTAFPKQLHGVYERAEMAQAGREDNGGEARVHKQMARDSSGSAAITAAPTTRVEPTEAELVAESETLFPNPQDDVERERIWTQITQLSARILESKTTPKEKKQWTEDKAAAWLTNCGTATPSTADLASLNDLKKWLETRQPK